MWRPVFLVALCSLGHVLGALVPPNALNLRISNKTTHEIPSTLYGYMILIKGIVTSSSSFIFGDRLVCGPSGDGGLYAELLQNRAFQKVIPGTLSALNGWQPYNGPFLSVTSRRPGVSSALPNSLEVRIPKVVSGPIGFENTGFWGIKIQAGWTYKGSFYATSDTFSGPVTVSLKSKQGTVYAAASAVIPQVGGKQWKKFSFQLLPKESAPDDHNVFSITVDGKAAAGQTIFFGMFSLFPPTFRGRENGMRIDLAEALAGTRPGVWRFPGGNNLEGHSFDSRWKWNETIGPIESRPGRVGDWTYANTDGLGLLEYLDWAEDLEAEPILGVWAGITISNFQGSALTGTAVVPEKDLQPYIDEALDEIEFIVGDPKTTKYGRLRSSLGREKPYKLKYVEIGNEDMFQPASYVAYRWKAFHDAIMAKYPDIELLATTLPSTTLNPAYQKIDFHQYAAPSWFAKNAFMFDNYPRNGTQFFVGEYAVISTNESNLFGNLASGRLAYPTLQGAVAEAAFMTGMERNSDVVFATAYAPSLQHIRNYQWTPDIITFDASHMVKSTSYYVQQMFATNRGTHVLQTTPASTAESAPLYWVASVNNETNVVFLKVVNTGTTGLVADLFFDFKIEGFYTAISISSPALSPISGQFNVSNTLEKPEQIIPYSNTFAIPDSDRFNHFFPEMSVTVLAVHKVD